MEDEKITALLFDRQEEGLRLLAEEYGTLLHTVACNILQNSADAAECVNDTYKKVWDRIPPYKPTHLRVFLCKLAKQIAIDRYRHDHAAKYGEPPVLFSELEKEISVSTEESDGEIAAYITEFLNTAKAEDRVFFIRRYFMSESVQSLATRFGHTPDYVSVKLHRTRTKLMKYLQKKGVTV